MATLTEVFTNIANAIRNRNLSITNKMKIQEFPYAIKYLRYGWDYDVYDGDNIGSNGGNFKYPITINELDGTTVEAKLGSKTLTSNNSVITLTGPGTWTITANKNGFSNSTTHKITGLSYYVDLSLNTTKIAELTSSDTFPITLKKIANELRVKLKNNNKITGENLSKVISSLPNYYTQQDGALKDAGSNTIAFPIALSCAANLKITLTHYTNGTKIEGTTNDKGHITFVVPYTGYWKVTFGGADTNNELNEYSFYVLVPEQPTITRLLERDYSPCTLNVNLTNTQTTNQSVNYAWTAVYNKGQSDSKTITGTSYTSSKPTINLDHTGTWTITVTGYGASTSSNNITINNTNNSSITLSIKVLWLEQDTIYNNPNNIVSTGIDSYGYASANSPTHGMLAGGAAGNPAKWNNIVVAYNTSLTKLTSTSSQYRDMLAGTEVGVYGLFSGGRYPASGTNTSTGTIYASLLTEAFNASFTRSTPTSLSTGKYQLSATNIGNYALFSGGYTGAAYSNTVEYYNNGLTKGNATALATAKYQHNGCKNNNYAFFAGGYLSSGTSNTIDTYNSSLTKGSATFSSTKYYVASSKVGNYALFTCGSTGTVDAFNGSLSRSVITSVSNPCSGMIGGMIPSSIGEFASFNNSNFDITVYDTNLTQTIAYKGNWMSLNSNKSCFMRAGNYGIYPISGNGSIYVLKYVG